MLIPDGYIRRVTSTIPFGYELDTNIDGYLNPVEQELEVLKEVTESVHRQEISLGVGVDWLEAETGRKLSKVGLKKHVDKTYGR